MLIAGEWEFQQDGVTRPIVWGELRKADGTWHKAKFLIDSGADQTVLDGPTAGFLNILPTAASTPLLGAGGPVAGLEIVTALRLERADGGSYLTFNSRFAVFPNPNPLDTNVLGRDILNLFAVILDRAADTIWLVRPSHRYVIVP